MKSKDKILGNPYRYSVIITVLLLIGILILFYISISYMVIRQSVITVGIATEYMDTVQWNTFINEMIARGNSTSYEVGYHALQEAGYQNSSAMLFLQPFILGSVMLTVIILVLIILIIILYFREKEKRILEIEKVTEWVHSDSFVFLDQKLLKYIPIEILQAVTAEKEKAVRQYMIQEENTESTMKYMENISHQLKTPLAVVRATCERVSMQHPEIEDKMQICQQQTDKMTFLIRDFLQLGRFDCHKQKMKFEYVRARDLIETVVNELDIVAQKRNITFAIHGKEEICWHCDVFWMEEILGNILKNCIEHSECGEISVNYEAINGMNQIMIRDCGAGLKEGLEKKIFERYTVVNRINIEGSGLGLSIAQEAIKLHFGTLTARNQSQGGIEFRISFPQLDSENIY